MDTAHEQRLLNLLSEALERPTSERRAFVEQACGDDPLLLAEALATLGEDHQIEGFLETPIFETPTFQDFGRQALDAEPAAPGSASASLEDGTRIDRPRPRRERPTQADPSQRTTLAGPTESEVLDHPERLGPYPITKRLGAGGMGEVLLAEDPRLGRRIAIKILAPELSRRHDLLQRFQREARALAALNHPNIVTIHSVEEDSGTHFLTMELVEGKTLADVIPEDGLPVSEILRISSQLSDALAEAHARGITHRDLKPWNVMLAEDGRVKVLDFGIAKLAATELMADADTLTQEGQVLGTVAYMAPEQLKGGMVDARADLFSLGVILYKMITGEHPFPFASPVAQMSAMVCDPAPPLAEQREGLPTALVEIVERCLEKEPEARFSNAAELGIVIEDLRSELHDTQLLEASARRRRPRLLAAAALLGVLLAGAAGWMATRPPAPVIGLANPAALEGSVAVAVLFFQNLSGDPQLEWLASGITEMLVTDLSQIPGIRPLSTSRLRALLDDLEGPATSSTLLPPEMARLAEASGVEAIARGTFVRLGETLRIDFTLEDVASGEILRSHTVEGQGEASLFELVDELGTTVRELFGRQRPDIGPATIADATTSSLEAWQAFTEAREAVFLSRREDALEHLRRAVEIDPSFALAHANLSRLERSLGRLEDARASAGRAIELRDRLPLNRRFSVEASYYSSAWATQDRAIESLELALGVYPENLGWRNNLARRYTDVERYPEALEHFERLVEVGIEEGGEFWGDANGAATVHAALGDFATGREVLEAFAERNPEQWLIHYALGWYLTEWDLPPEAAAAFDRAAELHPDTYAICHGRWRLAALGEDWPSAEREAICVRDFDDPYARWRGNLSLARNALFRGAAEVALGALDTGIDVATGADRALLRCLKASVLLARGDAKAALHEAQLAQDEGRDQFPELRAYFLAALAEQALGHPDRADALTETLRERWRRQPNAVEERQLNELLGRLALARGDLDIALAALGEAAALLPPHGVETHWHIFPQHVPIWTALGQTELAAGRPERALPWLERAVSSHAEHLEQPVDWVRAHYLLAEARRQLGQADAARQSLERFLTLWGNGDLEPAWLEAARQQGAS